MSNEWEGVTIECPWCQQEIDATSKKCDACGHVLKNRRPPKMADHRGGSPLAAVMSLVIPGAGQLYREQYRHAILWLLFVLVGYSAFVVPGIILHLCCIWAAYTN